VDLTYDPEIVAAFAARAAGGTAASVATLERGDWASIRKVVDEAFAAVGAALPATPEVSTRDVTSRGHDGADVALRWYSRDGSAPGSAVLYLHGGGMVAGSVELWDPFVRRYVAETGVPMLAPDYRLAPEHPHPTPVEDCYAGLTWLLDHAAELGVDPARVAVMGDSAGGGLAAAVALLARERGVALARQILVYPMLDDRTTVADPRIAPFATWTYDSNWTGWSALLGGEPGGPDVHWSAAPARAADLTGVAPADIDVGEIDIFCGECIEYARRLRDVGVSVDLHVFRGAPHASDVLAPAATSTALAQALRLRSIRSL
jgi:acetyl esterase/lipase